MQVLTEETSMVTLMKLGALAAIFVLAGSIQPALADSCQDRFQALYLKLDQSTPTRSEVTTAFKGAPPSTNDFLYVSEDHYMTVPISPAGPWILGYNNVLFQSSDEGKSWKKVREMDTGKNAEQARADKEANAATIRNAVCGEDEFDGEAVDVIAADITVKQGTVSENRYAYWVRRSDNFVVKSIYDTKASAFEVMITQVIKKAPDLTLPTPE